MSHTTEIILSVSGPDNALVEDISFWLASEAPRSDDRTDAPAGFLLPLTDQTVRGEWGGHKLTRSTIWAGVTNYLDLDGFFGHLATRPWQIPDELQVLVKDEFDPWFRLYMLRDGQLRQYAPAPGDEHGADPW